MEKLYYEIPSLKRKEQAIEYIKEHLEAHSDINGSGGLNRYIDDYEGWLEKLERDYVAVVSEERVPARTYYLINEDNDEIVGMVNIRTELNERLKKHGGNIGYGIRPSQRRKGYNKINLYLALKVCEEYNIENALLSALLTNEGSWKTMEALGGKRIKEEYEEEYQGIVANYLINVKESLNKYKSLYEPHIELNKNKIR